MRDIPLRRFTNTIALVKKLFSNRFKGMLVVSRHLLTILALAFVVPLEDYLRILLQKPPFISSVPRKRILLVYDIRLYFPAIWWSSGLSCRFRSQKITTRRELILQTPRKYNAQREETNRREKGKTGFLSKSWIVKLSKALVFLRSLEQVFLEG